MKSGVTTSRAAPVSEMLRTVQSFTPPPKLIDPVLSTRRRGAIRCSSPIASNYAAGQNLQPQATSQGAIHRRVSVSHCGQRYVASLSFLSDSVSFSPTRGISTRQFGQVTRPIGRTSSASCMSCSEVAVLSRLRDNWFQEAVPVRHIREGRIVLRSEPARGPSPDGQSHLRPCGVTPAWPFAVRRGPEWHQTKYPGAIAGARRRAAYIRAQHP
jgi:hypothetical protein